MKLIENKYLIFDREKEVNCKYFAKKAINALQNVFYKMLFSFIRPAEKEHTKYTVSICAIFRDEAAYLKEWIEFHLLAGVEHFYLYNNFSNDNYKEILYPYIEEGIVTLTDWPIKQGQMSAYKDFFERFSQETKWVGLIDIDEFVVPNKTATIGDFLSKFKNRPVVIMYWKVMGSSGIIERDINGLVTEDFTLGYRKYMDIGKVFFNTKYKYYPECKYNNYMHSMWGLFNNIALPPVNVFDKVCSFGFNPVSSSDMPIQINHYIIKSFREYCDKKSKRGGGVHETGFHTFDYYFRNEHKCQESDYSAFKFLVELKLKMGANRK